MNGLTLSSSSGVYGMYLKLPSGIVSPSLRDIADFRVKRCNLVKAKEATTSVAELARS